MNSLESLKQRWGKGMKTNGNAVERHTRRLGERGCNRTQLATDRAPLLEPHISRDRAGEFAIDE